MALNLAFEEMFSIPDAFGTIHMAGKTDLQIVTEGLIMHNIEGPNGNVPEFFACYLGHLAKTIYVRRGHVKPGVREALERLRRRDDVVLGLLTGNIESGAMLKLGAYGLAKYFDIGTFGDDDADRNRLLPIAVEKFRRKRDRVIGFRDCIVIGDTPRDVECSKPYGAFAIVVATGPYSYSDLSDTAADAVFHDLSDTDKFLAAVNKFN